MTGKAPSLFQSGPKQVAEGSSIVSAAYADPPYIGQAKKRYSHDPKCAEVDHAELIARLEATYDGWALSCNIDTN